MYMLGRNLKEDNIHLDKEELESINDIAKKTWKYFDDLLKEEYHYLIPDNYQLNREDKVDNKTSPTNIGFSLLSVISAYELGIISISKTIDILTNIISSIERLEKWHGHLYNWYDIYTMSKMHPHFISTVDNGNFTACLYVVKGFLEKQPNKQLFYRVKRLIDDMDFTFLYNKDMDVFSIGYSVDEQMLIPYNYKNIGFV